MGKSISSRTRSRTKNQIKSDALNALMALGVPPPSNGTKYGKEEAVKNILRFPKQSKERGAVTKAILSFGCESGKTSVYNLLKHSVPSGKGRTHAPTQTEPTQDISTLGDGYEGYFVRWSIRHNVSWRGKIALSLIPVKFGDYTVENYKINPGHLKRRIEEMSPQSIDICSILGNTDLATVMNESLPRNSFQMN